MRIAIWGAGEFGCLIKSKIEALSDVQLVCFLDGSRNKDDSCVGGTRVLHSSRLSEIRGTVDAVLISVIKAEAVYEIIEQLKEEKYHDFGVVKVSAYDREREFLFNDHTHYGDIRWNTNGMWEKPLLNIMETNLIDVCNLNCRACSHFAQLFPKGNGMTLQTFQRDIRKVAENITVLRFNLLGGEVLLKENLEEYIRFIREQMINTEIYLVSNGILIPGQSDSLLQCLHDHHINVEITAYKPTLGLEKQIRSTLEKYKITYYFRKQVEDFGRNIDLKGQNDPYTAQRACRQYKCHMLRNGKLYKCPFQALGQTFFSHYGLTADLGEGIDIYQEDLNWEKSLRKLYEEPVEGCKFCGKEERIPWSVSADPGKEDWLISEQI